jgi:hypothetical protein
MTSLAAERSADSEIRQVGRTAFVLRLLSISELTATTVADPISALIAWAAPCRFPAAKNGDVQIFNC